MFSLDLTAQKVKYKDLFVLLSANDFEQAEPFLRRFIVQDPEHANANMYMGRMFQYKYSKKDVLKESDLYTAYCDSAVLYFRQAYNLIDEKEIKKNDEYYQDYSRRDLRTGKFGVKLADVKFDIEKKIDEIEKLSRNVKSLNEDYDNALLQYQNADRIYNGLRNEFGTMTALLLKSEDSDLDSLKKLGEYYEGFNSNFQTYKQTLLLIPGTDYRQELTVKFVEGLNQSSVPDFSANEIPVYDFKSWTDEAIRIIAEEIKPMKENMSVYDQQLDDLYKQVTVDSMTVENELASLTEKMFFEQLNNYDSDPLPSLVFNFKVDEITYYSYRNHAITKGQLDSANLDVQLNTYKDLFEKYSWVENAYHELAKVNVVEKSDLYSEYVATRFGNVSGLVEYIANKGEEVKAGKSSFVHMIDSLEEISKWGIHELDSIPLFIDDSTALQYIVDELSYKTLTTDSIETGYLLTGIRTRDSKIENFASIVGFDRIVDTVFTKAFNFKVDTADIKGMQGWTKSYPRLNEGDNGFIYITQVRSVSGSEAEAPKSNYQISNLIPATGIKWSSTFENPFSVLEVNIDMNTALIVLKMGELKDDGEENSVENLVFNFEGKLMLTGN